MRHLPTRKTLLLASLLLLLAGAGTAIRGALAGGEAGTAPQGSPMHPTLPLLDQDGTPVLDSGNPVSTMQTCGQCHDTAYIAGHSFHADLGMSETTAPGKTGSQRAWDTSPGLFGKWNPLTYRYLSPTGDERTDLDPASWLKFFAGRVVGGGPGGLEMDCFVCHLAQPNLAERTATIQSGESAWTSTATLEGTGIVEKAGAAWQWNPAAFDEKGEVKAEWILIQEPSNENCNQCHGIATGSVKEPLAVAGCALDEWQTATTGQVVSPQKIADSGTNLAGKEEIARSWDIHAERGLSCTDCHYSLNNPVKVQPSPAARPGHLLFDPRRLDLGEYLQKPDHNFARGQSAQYTVAPELKGSMRRCESCHDAANTHDWLPYTERHLSELACESCHIPQMYAPAVEQYDWTVLQADGKPASTCRGAQGKTGTLSDLVTGFQPVLMPRQNVDSGGTSLAPYNLATAWYWEYEDKSGHPRPVRLEDLKAAWLEGDDYAPEILAGFDTDGDGGLSSGELKIDTPEKESLIAGRLQALGLNHLRIAGEIQPYSINHGVAHGEWATKDCQVCHAANSRLAAPVKLADAIPGGVMPEFVHDASTRSNGSLYVEDGALYYRPATSSEKLYVFGHDRVPWIDWLGALSFLGVLGAVSVHGGLRFTAALRQPKKDPGTRKVYMYAVYERFWHWLQTFAIVLLLFTGLVIHRPDVFGLFSFRYVVVVHNVLAGLLVINAALSLFYHLVSGEIRQYIPHPYGFFDQAIVQAKFYLQGIFKGDGHPFEKTPQKKLNPLQQITYFGILNVLLPLQILTGALMWGTQRWPQAAGIMGGLPFLAPFHSLVAWLFGAFIVAHVYLTTTGHEPLSSIQAMMTGWDEIEEPAEPQEEVSEHERTGADQETKGDIQSEGAAI